MQLLEQELQTHCRGGGADGIPSELFKLAEEAIKKLTVLAQQMQNRSVRTGD